MSALSSSKVVKYEYLLGEEILLSGPSQMTNKPNFHTLLLEKNIKPAEQ